jgi:hypothetical protein
MPEADACAITMSLHSLEPVPPPDPRFAALIDSILPDAPPPDSAPPDPDERFAALVDSILPDTPARTATDAN